GVWPKPAPCSSTPAYCSGCAGPEVVKLAEGGSGGKGAGCGAGAKDLEGKAALGGAAWAADGSSASGWGSADAGCDFWSSAAALGAPGRLQSTSR
ncbi:MAG: hypothetical protein KGQ26_09905, partial [Rhodospirillales bacterium]|nr:hypothetical protein [Rhodospirillales bacterium]